MTHHAPRLSRLQELRSPRRPTCLVLAALTVLLATAGIASPAGATGYTVNARVSSWFFDPEKAYAGTGDTIVWTNSDCCRQHSVTADDGSFDSGPLSPNQTFSRTFNTASTFHVHDTFLPAGLFSPGEDVIIQSSSTPPKIFIDDTATASGGLCTFRVHLTRQTPDVVTVHWSTKNGTAKAGSDYVAAQGTLAFSSGQASGQISVQTIFFTSGDVPGEKFSVVLDSPTNASLLDRSGDCILDPGV